MSRQAGIRALVAGGVLVVVGVVGVAAKVGRDTSLYLQTVSAQRNWDSLGQAPEAEAGGSSLATPRAAVGAESAVIPGPEAVASR